MKLNTTGLIVFFLLNFYLLQNAGAEYRIALVIGNGAYSSGPLSDPPNDSQLMTDTLAGLGFEVMGKNDINQNKMRTLIRDFGNRLKNQKNSVGLFYYSGHGMQVEGHNYMIPVNVPIEDESDVKIYGVDVNEVLTRMRFAENAINLVFLDACRNNPFEKSFKSATKGLVRVEAPKGTLIAFAAQPHKVAQQGPGKYSYFTEALAKELVKPDISVRDMLLNTRITVYEKTRKKQLPVVEDQMLAKFYFKKEDKKHNGFGNDKYSIDRIIKGHVRWHEQRLSSVRVELRKKEDLDFRQSPLSETITNSEGEFSLRVPKTEGYLVCAISPNKNEYHDWSCLPTKYFKEEIEESMDIYIEKYIELISPIHAINDTTPVLKWRRFPYAKIYVVTLFDDTSKKSLMRENVKDNKVEVRSNLLRGHKYQWSVHAYASSKPSWQHPLAYKWGFFSVKP